MAVPVVVEARHGHVYIVSFEAFCGETELVVEGVLVAHKVAKRIVLVMGGSGLVAGRSVDGDPTATGLRILVSDPPLTGAVGEYWQVDGICASETWTEYAWSKTVRTILAPSFRRLL